MTESYRTEQEAHWAGEFGTQYTERNRSARYVRSNIALFAKILSKTENVQSLIEFGSNIGLNLMAIRQLMPHVELSAVEINRDAVNALVSIDGAKVYHTSILDFSVDYARDLVLVKGVLIHLNPDMLRSVYKTLVEASRRYVCLVEYYNPTPVEVLYRGQEKRLFKRDFAGEILDSYEEVRLLDYGFVYHRDANFPQDDVNWFLLEKK